MTVCKTKQNKSSKEKKYKNVKTNENGNDFWSSGHKITLDWLTCS